MGIAVLIKRWWSVFVIIPCLSGAQVSEDFSDGNFSSNPSWTGDTELFRVNDDYQLQLDAAAAGQAALFTAVDPMTAFEWRCWVKLSFSPSGNNNARIYLFTQDSSPGSFPDGIFLQLGEAGALDAIRLMQQKMGDTDTLVCGAPGAVASSFTSGIKVIYSEGEWRLFVDYSGGEDFLVEGVAPGPEISGPGYLGVICLYTTSNSTKFYYDDFYAGPIQYDTIPPEAIKVEVSSATSLELEFSERVDAESAGMTANYHLSADYGSPAVASINADDASRVELTYSDSLQYGQLMQLSIQNITDLAGNAIVPSVMDFTYYSPDRYDVVINEIMADPSPPNSLPEYEYIELYNTTALPLNLSGWTLTIGSAEKPLTGLHIPPDGFVIIASKEAESLFASMGQFYGLESFALVNSGQSIVLTNENHEIMHSLYYSEKWYADEERSDGGYSLEQVNPYIPCGMADNWGASQDYLGGTPGKQNSLYGLYSVAPAISNICVLDSLSIYIEFNQSMHTSTSLYPGKFVLNNGLGPVEAVLPDNPYLSSFILYPKQPLERNKIYELSIADELSNCVDDVQFISETVLLGIPEKPAGQDLIINEILFDPFPGGVDYVEVFNRSEKVINLVGLSLASVNNSPPSPPDTSIYSFSLDCRILLPGEYVLLCKDLTRVDAYYYCKNTKGVLEMDRFPSYGNEDGCVILMDERHKILDLFSYHENMHYPLLNSVEGVSLERVHPDRPASEKTNWHSASQMAGFGTPSYENSQYLNITNNEREVWVSPRVFTPGNDGMNDLINLHYRLDIPGYLATILIFNTAGHVVRHLVNNELLGTKGTYSWDGIKDDHQKAGPGIYIILAELIDLNGRVIRHKETLVVAP